MCSFSWSTHRSNPKQSDSLQYNRQYDSIIVVFLYVKAGNKKKRKKRKQPDGSRIRVVEMTTLALNSSILVYFLFRWIKHAAGVDRHVDWLSQAATHVHMSTTLRRMRSSAVVLYGQSCYYYRYSTTTVVILLFVAIMRPILLDKQSHIMLSSQCTLRAYEFTPHTSHKTKKRYCYRVL